jgi:archaellum component FlaC
MCEMTKNECDKKFNDLVSKVKSIRKAMENIRKRSDVIGDKLIELANNPETTPEQFEELSTEINTFEVLYAKLSKMDDTLGDLQKDLEFRRRTCNYKNCKPANGIFKH